MNYRHKNLNDALKRVLERVADNIQTQHNRAHAIGRGRLARIGRLSRTEHTRIMMERDENERIDDEE